MKKLLCVLSILIAVPALLAFPHAAPAEEEEIATIVTIVPAPDQTGPERPPCFPDPAENYIPMPDTENYALGKQVISGAHTDVYVDKNVNDGSTSTYWESKGFPAEITFNLDGLHTVTTVTVSLNPSPVWEKRTQEIAVLVSTDGENFTQTVPAARYEFDAETGNRIRIDFESVDAAWVRLIFTLNTSSRTGGAQAAEIGIY